jgi:hypothetical protein
MTEAVPDPVARWHAVVESGDPAALHDLLDPDAVFESPVVHTPQRGRAIASRYLLGALAVLNNDSFRYLGEWRAERSAVLEFETVLDGVTVNGVDMIWWSEAGVITRFKVLVRPLKAIETVRALMAAQLAAASVS